MRVPYRYSVSERPPPPQMTSRPQAERRERRWVFLLVLIAAARVFLFSAAFPPFDNVDEQSHFDLVHKYSRGHVPPGLEHVDADAARLIVLYGTPEYLNTPDQYPDGALPPPPWPLAAKDRVAFERVVSSWIESVNHESTQPPLYYQVAGVWYRIGERIGLRGGYAFYWTRFLNVFACALLTWLAYLFARTGFPDRTFLRLGVPFLVAFFPQDAFYSVNNDVFLPLVGGAAFLCLLLVCRGAPRGFAFHACTGLLVAAAILVKFSSVAIVPVSGAMVAFGVLRLRNAEDRRAAILKGAVLFAAASVPIGAWCARNYLLLGDVTGSASKTQYLGWTFKPLAAMFAHPVFTPSGIATFWRGTLATFWRGEFVWGLQPMASPGWDRFYSISSFALIVVAVIAPMTWRKEAGEDRRFVLWTSLCFFVLSLAFLAAISVMYDFGECFYPSRAMPYLTSGRLSLGALIPFAALYVSGLDSLLPTRLGARGRWVVLIVLIAWMTFSDLRISGVAFRSAYNWFHMI